MKFKNLLYTFLGSTAILSSVACSEEALSDESIFPVEESKLDPNSYSYKFDKWLLDSLCTPYNLDFRYRMEDVGSNMDYNLVPATYQNSVDLAILAKYLWFDVYKKVSGDPEFLQKVSPRIIHVIGSPAYNPTLGTMILGTAEGGIKVTLYRVNYLDPTNVDQLNEYYFKTMHHEFGHILHQTKLYPNEFRTVSNGYDPSSWQDKNFANVLSRGFMTPYSTNMIADDWVELIANYVIRSDEWLEQAMWIAEREWYEEESDENYLKKKSSAFYYYKNDADMKNDVKTYFCTIDGGAGDTENFNIKDRDLVIENADGSYTHKTSRRPAYAVANADGELDGVKGREILEHKLDLVRTWFREKWNIDLEVLRAEVQQRQKNIDIDELRKQIENIPIPEN